MPTDRDLMLSRPVSLPVEGLAAIVGRWPEPAILESGAGFGPTGRWSVFAARPRLVFEATDASWRIRSDSRPVETGKGDPIGRLGMLLEEYGLGQPEGTTTPDPEAAPFRGGMIGHLGYDLAPQVERLGRKAGRESRFPDIRLGLYDTAIVADHGTGLVEFRAWDLLVEGAAALLRRWDLWERALRAEVPAPGSALLHPPRSDVAREDYLAAIRKAIDYIRAGDVFQVNLSQRFSSRALGAPIVRPDPMALYLGLRSLSPAPFAAFLRWKDLAVASASPELFYESRGRRIVTRPIKGTRPRGNDPAEDDRLVRDLLASPKDRAELTMIVDLERNDLGRVCEYGSVRVTRPGALESFAQVHHLVATVEGVLRRGIGPADLIRATFPGGSITGAPKIRAMQIIDELEPRRRSLYTGAIGYLSRGGSSAFNIAIRTLLVEGDEVHYQVGGGIVADSDPEAEYQETIDKGRGLRLAVAAQVDPIRGNPGR